jgi:hypothetical protein
MRLGEFKRFDTSIANQVLMHPAHDRQPKSCSALGPENNFRK